MAGSSSSAQIPRADLGIVRGSNFGWAFFILALLMCIAIGVGVVGIERAPASSLLEVPGVAFVDGRGLASTRTHLMAANASSSFVVGAPCVFLHGEPVRLISAHENELHAANPRCSAWLPSGWLSAQEHPALGLLTY